MKIIDFSFQIRMCPANVSRLQHPGVRAYLQYCKCCKFCFVICQLFSEPRRQNRGAELVQNKIELQLHQLFSGHTCPNLTQKIHNCFEINVTVTVTLTKPWKPEIFVECYYVVRSKPIRREITKPQTATVISPFAPGDFAEKRVLKLVEWFCGHCRAIKS